MICRELQLTKLRRSSVPLQQLIGANYVYGKTCLYLSHLPIPSCNCPKKGADGIEFESSRLSDFSSQSSADDP